MPPTASRINSLNASYQGNSHKRKCNPCKQRELKSYEGFSLTLNANAGKKSISFDLPPRTVGDDGHYYECVVCDNDGELLCCDTCPCTYHLQCINPPLKSVPPGTWQCEKCCQGTDLLTPLSSLKSLKKKSSSEKVLQNPPAGSFQSLHQLADPGDLMEKTSQKYVDIDEEQNAANHTGREKRSETSSAANEIKVYRRRVQKKFVQKEENNPKNLTKAHDPSESVNQGQKGKLTTDTSGLFDCSIIVSDFAEPANKVLENDDPSASRPQQPKESNSEPEDQGSKAVHQAISTSDCNQSPNTYRYDKLWLLRDVMQESIKDQHSMQNNGKRELHQAVPPTYTESVTPKREKYARLRARQKQKIALRNTIRGLIPGSRIVGQEPLLQMGAEAIESVRVHTSENEPKEHIFQEPLPVKEESFSIDNLLYKSADLIYGRLNLSHYRQSRFGGKLPVFSPHRMSDAGCSTRFSVNSREISDLDVSMQMLSPSAVPRGGKNPPWVSLGSKLASTSQLSKNVDSRMMMSGNSTKDQVMADFWLQEELDCLWMGVRRHGQGNWEAMLKDSSLSFFKHRTIEDLSQRWKMERVRIFNPGDLATQGSANSLSMDPRLNCFQVADTTLPNLKDQPSSNQGNQAPQNLLLGGLINIPKLKIDSEAREDASQIRRSEAKELSSEGTISD